MEKTIHVFEDAGMGKAPFKLIGLYSIPSSSLGATNPDAYNNMLKAMPKGIGIGSCAYCGTPLVHNFIIESACGKKSPVGCDCVAKTDDKGLVKAIKLEKSRVNREKRQQEQKDKYDAMLNQQREKNGGLTDYEINNQKAMERKLARELALESVITFLEPFLIALKHDGSSFSNDLYRQLSTGDMNVYPRAASIVKQITAKQAGRLGSKKFNARYDELEVIWNDAIAVYKEAPEDRA